MKKKKIQKHIDYAFEL